MNKLFRSLMVYKMMQKKVVVIGAGIAGLAAAVRLRCKGMEVEVYEAAAAPGGKLSELRLGNYRFDRGPSLFTLPHLVEELFDLAGENVKEHFSYQQLYTVCRYFFEDGQVVSIPASREKYIDTLVEQWGESRQQVMKYLEQSANTYEITAPVFLHRSLPKWKDVFSSDVLKALSKSWKLPLTGSLHQRHQSFFQNPKTIQFFDRYATYNGSNPYQSPAMMMLIPHVENGIGAFLPKGGMVQISRSIYELGKRLGVKYHFNAKVEEILHANKKVAGVKVNGTIVNADAVFANADMHTVYAHLLRNAQVPEKKLAQEKSSAALIFYWGIKKQLPELDVHNILFAENYEEEFDMLFKKKKVYHDPTVYIHITQSLEKSDAPEYGSNWFVMINVPPYDEEWSDEVYKQLRQTIIQKINRVLKINIESWIEEETYWTPRGIEADTSSYRGSLYGNASNTPYAAFMRHANQSSEFKNLYFCGGSVHPGGGVPLCLLSAKIAVEEMEK
ncbi:MAG: hypothetical protein RLZZ77_963 [Bacteroidota bacterium]